MRRRDRFVATTWVVGGGAVLAGLIGAGLYLFDAPSAEGVSVTPAISASSAGAFVTGRF